MPPPGLDRRRVLAVAGAVVGSALIGTGSVGARQAGTPVARPSGRGDVLITVPELAAAQAGPVPPVVVALTDPEGFAAGHIPRARLIDWPELELGATTPAAIATWSRTTRLTLAGLGVTPSSDVVIYDGGSLFAARLWWILDYLGHERKRVLDGGLPAWIMAGQSVDTRIVPDRAGTSSIPPYPDTAVGADRLATKDEILATLGDPGVVLIDARGSEEYAAGHIPGAVRVPYPANARPDDPKTFLGRDELVTLYATVGATPDRRVIPYCSTGVRSAVTYQALRLAGFTHIGLYTGSWDEWSADPSAPVETR
ncbi:MAG TPA: rhodanese-like domain-containing protein [Thermomicrobiales bacterium]|jgi:thiosulfate/3-mercaptopyruvate sulfurtransferase|nr:rhodanese-like domain-containing protein [Thermomicrobiales bacterium]